MDLREQLRRKYERLSPAMSERTRRLWAGTEADSIGYGGLKAVADATGLALSTVQKGRTEIRRGVSMSEVVRDRRPGAGRKLLETKDPELVGALDKLVEPTSRGDPESALRWTSKSTTTLANELTRQGHPVSANKVGRLLNGAGYSLQGAFRVKEGRGHPDRDAQFQHINAHCKAFLTADLPVISVDTKKKEPIGEFHNKGREWQPKGTPVEVMTYDFSNPKTPKAVPYGVYDVGNNKGFVNVGTDHDTPVFATHSIERWWQLMGSVRYPKARELFITADSGGSNAKVSRVWKAQLQEMADRYSLTIHVSHYPPGTSKWNRIEHRLFSFISLNWRGRPLASYETVVSLIAGTTTSKGLRISAELDRAKYPLGIKVSTAAFRHLNVEASAFHGDWNYALRPRTPEQLEAARDVISEPKPVPHKETREKWDRLIREQRASGLDMSAFCRKHGISRSGLKAAKLRVEKLIGPLKAHTD